MLGLDQRNDAFVAGELAWQSKVEGEAARMSAFKDQALGLMAFWRFAFMKPKSPAIQLAHSLGEYFGLSGLSPELQDRQVAFIGDRGPGQIPFLVLLPPNNLWALVKTKGYLNITAFTTHYEDDANANRLWMLGVAGDQLSDVNVPRLLALPHFVTDFIVSTGHCLPHMLRKRITEHNDGKES